MITGPAGSGKTEAAMDFLCAVDPASRSSGFRYIVPTVQMVRRIELRLMQRTGTSGILGNTICTFYGFAQEIIAREGLGTRLITDIHKNLMLDNLVLELRPDYYMASAAYPGFSTSLDQIIGELKTSLVDPANLRNAFTACKNNLTPDSQRKIEELIRIYEQYQENILIKHGLVDREGVMWLALEYAKQIDFIPKLECVVFDGFSSLNGVQKEFLAIIADRVSDLVVTLPYEPDRPDVFGPLEKDHSYILNLPNASEVRLHRSKCRATALQALEFGVFRKSVECVKPDDSITIIKGGNRSIEVELVAEQIKKLVRNESLKYTEIALTARDIDSYRSCFERVFDEYEIPLEPSERPASESACIGLLNVCCDIVCKGWLRDDVFKALHSELLSSDLISSCQVQVNARQLGISYGRENWMKSWGEDDSTSEFRIIALAGITAFEDSLKNAKSLDEYTSAFRTLVSTFKRTTKDEALIAEDCAARKLIDQVLSDLLDALSYFHSIPKVETFVSLFKNAISRCKISFPGRATDCVNVVSASSMSGQRFQAVFALGMLEQAFPKQSREDSFLRDSERYALNRQLNSKLEMRLDQKNAEKALFYSVIGAAGKRLFLCYPTSDESGRDCQNSSFIDDARKVFNQGLHTITRDIANVIPETVHAETLSSLYRSIVYRISHLPEGNAVDAALAYNSLIDSNNLGLNQVFRDYKESDARLEDTRIINRSAEIHRTYRCTELETYAACPFMHFCQSKLGLEPVREQVGGLDVGGVLHKVLYRLYSDLRDELGSEFKVSKLNAEATMISAHEMLAGEFSLNPRLNHLPKHQAEILENTLRGYLSRCITGDINSKRDDYVPTYFELEFGNKANPERPRDPGSSDTPLVIRSEDGERAAICGKIDRVDISSEGAIVIDYKLGASTSMLKFEDGLTLQAMIYALAMRDLFNHLPVGAEYRPLKKWTTDGYYSSSSGISSRTRLFDEQEFAEKLKTCESSVMDIVKGIRSGRISVEPKDCKSYCSFKGVCRIDDYKLLKLKQSSPPSEDIEA